MMKSNPGQRAGHSASEVYIVAARRTPIGKFQGSLADRTAPQLGAAAIAAALDSAGLDQEARASVGAVYMGQVLTAGAGQAPARQAALGAGLSDSVPCMTVGKVCGSGLQSVILAHNDLTLGYAELAVAGGQESMSRAPYLLAAARAGFRLGHQEATDSLIHDGLWDPYSNRHMGSCAEDCATRYGFTRELQDAFALESYRRVAEAYEKGAFSAELVALESRQGKQVVSVNEDEEFRGLQAAKVPLLRPAFASEGTITAANASKINDGAAALVLASGTACQRWNLKPLVRVVASAVHAQAPGWFTTAPAVAMGRALDRAGWRAADVDLFEINEAFANVTMAAMRELDLAPERVNVHGGAIALGHPIGASGARILTTLIHAMLARGGSKGLASICIGGGEALAVAVERV